MKFSEACGCGKCLACKILIENNLWDQEMPNKDIIVGEHSRIPDVFDNEPIQEDEIFQEDEFDYTHR